MNAFLYQEYLVALASVPSVSARVRRENWVKEQKRRPRRQLELLQCGYFYIFKFMGDTTLRISELVQ